MFHWQPQFCPKTINMRITVQPARPVEGDFKSILLNYLLKILFVLGVGVVVFIITSKTYVPPAGMNNNYERVLQVFEAGPPMPY